MNEQPGNPLIIEREGAVVRLIINRPKEGNAVTLEMAQAILRAAIACDDDPDVRCVVLTGSGPFFCVGGDISALSSTPDSRSAFLNELVSIMHMAIARLARMNKPLLVLVNGPAAGAGVSLTALGDVVLCAESAHFTMAYSAIGLTPDGGVSWWLPRLVGLRKAQEMIFTNRRISSTEAEAIGLVTRMVKNDMLASEGAGMAKRLASAASGAFGATRLLLLESYGTGLETQMEREVRAITSAVNTPESREGIAAFLEKRTPDFSGLRAKVVRT